MTELKTIKTEHLAVFQTQAQSEAGEASEILKSIDDMVLETQDDLDFAGGVLVEIRTKKKVLEGERSKATGPLYKVIRLVEGWFRPAIQHYEKAENKLKKRIGEYHVSKRIEMQAALEIAGEASMHGDKLGASAAMQVATEAKVHKVPGVGVSDVVKYKLVDLAEVPREFLKLDDDAVSAYIAEHGAEAKIPGLKIWKDVNVSARAAKGAS